MGLEVDMGSSSAPLALALLLMFSLASTLPAPTGALGNGFSNEGVSNEGTGSTQEDEQGVDYAQFEGSLASGRNSVAASISQHGELDGHPAWLLGIDGTGVIIASADSGIDRDHACFRDATEPGASGSEWNNATGTPGVAHRKILFLDESIDNWDSQGHEHFTHGTHVAGSLVCRSVYEQAAEDVEDWLNATPGEGTSLSHGAKLVFTDVVGDDGWVVPEPSVLFTTAAENGAVIRSDSWGDATTDYTERTRQFDSWLHSVPWALSIVAPGNTGNEVQEPANGFNVVSVGVAKKDGSDDLWMLTPHSPTAQGRQGVEFVVPGVSIVSATSDGEHNSYNDGWKSNSGSSMAAPQAAAAAALVQQMVQGGWIAGGDERFVVVLNRPGWATVVDENLSDGELLLAEGFTPSGSLLRALLSLSAESIEGGRQGSIVLGPGPDDSQGWGLVNLSRLVDFTGVGDSLGDEPLDPAPNIWIHDSFRLKDDNWQEVVASWLDGEANSAAALQENEWRGEGAEGPFLSNGESQSWLMPLVPGEDFEVRLAWTSTPHPNLDDLDLVVEVDGEWYHGNQFDGWNSSASEELGLGQQNSTLEGVRISAERLVGIESVTVTVKAVSVVESSRLGVVGMNGDSVGFALAVKGVLSADVRPESSWEVGPNVVGDGEVSSLWPLFIAVLLIGVAVVIEVGWTRGVTVEEAGVTKGQPSNPQGVSLSSAVAPHTGEEE